MPQARSAQDEKPSDISIMSFEEALAELERIVQALESGQATLEDSIRDYTRGMQLKEHCAKKLSAARLQVEKIITASDGTVTTEPFDAEA